MTIYQLDQPRAYRRRFPAIHRPAADGPTTPADRAGCLKLDLSRALHLWPAEICLESLGGISKLQRQLRQALRRQRGHAISGHWSYDLTYHARLLDLYRRTEYHHAEHHLTEALTQRAGTPPSPT